MSCWIGNLSVNTILVWRLKQRYSVFFILSVNTSLVWRLKQRYSVYYISFQQRRLGKKHKIYWGSIIFKRIPWSYSQNNRFSAVVYMLYLNKIFHEIIFFMKLSILFILFYQFNKYFILNFPDFSFPKIIFSFLNHY